MMKIDSATYEGMAANALREADAEKGKRRELALTTKALVYATLAGAAANLEAAGQKAD